MSNTGWSGYFTGIAIAAPNDIWAVGGSQMQHWNGSQWTPVGGPADNLAAVAALGPNDVWAAGSAYSGNEYHPQIEHWNGSQWILNSGLDAISGQLYGVAASASNDVWAVGADGLIVHCDGSTCSMTPSGTGTTLRSVTSISPDDVWAVGGVGQTLTVHWNGDVWSVVASPNGNGHNELHSVSAVASNDVWAVGAQESPTVLYRTLFLHWNGVAWSIVSSPNFGDQDNLPLAVAAVTSNDVWVAGEYYDVPNSRYSLLLMHWNGNTWANVTAPGQGNLAGIAAVNGNDVWAVGGYWSQTSTYALIEHHTSSCATLTHTPTRTATVTGTPPTGTPTRTPTQTRTATSTPTCSPVWVEAASPNQGPYRNYLQGVAVLTANDAWAVGSYFTESNLQQTQIEHWDGSSWSVVSSPNNGTGWNELRAVAAISADDVWAVGTADGQSLTEHWDGSQWSIVPSPNTGGGTHLYGVAALSSNNVWAVGFDANGGPAQADVQHWDGSQWIVVPSPTVAQSVLLSVAVVAANDVWAAGYWYDVTSGSKTLVEHWDGSQWTVVASPNVPSASNSFRAITALNANDVWAVGDYYPGQINYTLIEHWNGTAWSIVSSPSPGPPYNFLYGVSAVAANDVWAVGSSGTYTHYQTLTEHWNGSSWSVVSSPNRGPNNELFAVDALAGNDVWAVGDFNDTSGATGTLVEHYQGQCATATATPAISNTPTVTRTPTQTFTPTPTVTGTPPTPLPTPTATHGIPPTGSPPPHTPTATVTGTPPTALPSPSATHMPPTVTVTPTSGVPPTGSPPPLPTATRTVTIAPTTQTPGGPSATTRPTNTAVTPSATGTPTRTATGTDTPPVTATSTATVTVTVTNVVPTTTPCTVTFSDVPANSVFYAYIRCLACRGIISGYEDGTFRPGNEITRGQIAKMVSNAGGFTEEPGVQIFEDVDQTSTFYIWINRLSNRGIMGGYPCGTLDAEPCNPPENRPYFRPFANATRGQLAKIVSNAAGIDTIPTAQFYADVVEENPFYVWVMRLTDLGVMSGYDCGGPGEPCDSQDRPYFRPFNNVTRGQASKIVANTFFPGCDVGSRR